jgi:hypothetical protein
MSIPIVDADGNVVNVASTQITEGESAVEVQRTLPLIPNAAIVSNTDIDPEDHIDVSLTLQEGDIATSVTFVNNCSIATLQVQQAVSTTPIKNVAAGESWTFPGGWCPLAFAVNSPESGGGNFSVVLTVWRPEA